MDALKKQEGGTHYKNMPIQPENLILFGAGASFGSDSANTPPLGSKLFCQLRVFAPRTWGCLQPPWPKRFVDDFESAMGELIDERVITAPHQWDMAKYFFTQFQVGPQNLYVQLIKGISSQLPSFSLATLNYDTLLFQAFYHLRVSWHMDSPPPSSSAIRVYLPHGSSMLYSKSFRVEGIAFTGRIATATTPRSNVAEFKSYAEFCAEMQSNSLPPIMSYFEPQKLTSSGADFIKHEREQFEQFVASASRIAVVGLKVRPSDTHIWGPLSKADAPILYVSGPTSKHEFDEWSRSSGRSHDLSIPKSFSDGFDDLIQYFQPYSM